jgi:uncharacterized protein YodC (DUF2158 family)
MKETILVPGTLVRLKSGGPVMTVVALPIATAVEGGSRANHWCGWFVGSEYRQADLHADALEVVETAQEAAP